MRRVLRGTPIHVLWAMAAGFFTVVHEAQVIVRTMDIPSVLP
jgi:hypothetical protein